MDLVSVIIPYYRKKEYIELAINSVIQQTYKKFEIIIIYDDTNKEDLNLIRKIKRNMGIIDFSYGQTSPVAT